MAIRGLKRKEILKLLDEGHKNLLTLSNPVRLQILDLLMENKEGLSITDIANKLNKELKYDFVYKNYFKHIMVLKKYDYVTLEKQKKTKGRPVIVKLNKDSFPIKLWKGNHEYPLL